MTASQAQLLGRRLAAAVGPRWQQTGEQWRCL